MKDYLISANLSLKVDWVLHQLRTIEREDGVKMERCAKNASSQERAETEKTKHTVHNRLSFKKGPVPDSFTLVLNRDLT